MEEINGNKYKPQDVLLIAESLGISSQHDLHDLRINNGDSSSMEESNSDTSSTSFESSSFEDEQRSSGKRRKSFEDSDYSYDKRWFISIFELKTIKDEWNN